MFDILYGFITAWLAIGFGLWLSIDAREFVDQTTRAYLKRCGRLPGPGFLLFCTVLIIVAWPDRVRKIPDSIEARRRERA
jgi:hypothetical protein